MKNHTAFVRMRSGDYLGDTKMTKRGTSLHRSYFFQTPKTKMVFADTKKMGRQNKTLPPICLFLPQDLVMIFQSLATILPRLFNVERP